VFRLSRPARLLITVYGPGPGCARLGTFSRRGRAGVNRVRFSGTLFGRALAPGSYAIVVHAVRGDRRVRLGRVLVVILPYDGREGGSRPLAAPDCSGGFGNGSLGSASGDSGQLAALSADSSGSGTNGAGTSSGDRSGGVAGVSAGEGDNGDDQPLLPGLPTLPALPSGPLQDALDVPQWAFLALGVLGALVAAAFVAAAIRRRREDGAWE
jgi:hypothetical protein